MSNDTCTWTLDPLDGPYIWGATCDTWTTACGEIIGESEYDPTTACPYCGRRVHETTEGSE